MGRPSDFTQATADTICERLIGGESLRNICTAEDMPNASTVFRWLADERYATFREQYTRARETQADALFDEILDIADDGRNDWMERQNFDGAETGWHLNGEALARSRLRVDARKWMAGKLQPKKYGEKLDIDQKTTLEASDSLTALLNVVATSGKRLTSDGDDQP